jgi:hypothetical protein
MYGLVCFELEEQSIERFKVILGRVGVEVEYGGKREAQEEVISGAAG